MSIIGATRLLFRSRDHDALDREREIPMRFLEFLFILDVKSCPPQVVLLGARLIDRLAS